MSALELTDMEELAMRWLSDHWNDRETQRRAAQKAYDALKGKDTAYARGILATAQAHEKAAAVYVDARIAFREQCAALRAQQERA